MSAREEALAPARGAARERPAHERVSRLAHLAMAPLVLFFLFPWAWLLSTALKQRGQIFTWPPVWIPSPIYLDNFAQAVQIIPFGRYMANTLEIALLVVVGRLLSCSAAAYALSHVRWPGRDRVFLLVLATMMLPFQVTMIPQYIIFHRLGWVNTILPLTVPAFLGDAFFVFLLRQFFLTIPHEMVEAAEIDGCSEIGTFLRVVLPLAQPALATLVVLSFLHAYTDFLGPLLYLTDPELRTLSLGMQAYTADQGSEWGPLMAAALLFTTPLLIVYLLTQRRFVQGIATTGLK